MKKVKVLSVFVLLALIAASIMACSPSTETAEEAVVSEEADASASEETAADAEEAALPGEGMKFVSITNLSTNLSAISMNEGAREVLEGAGAEFTALYYEDNLNTMVGQIENAVASGYNGMILQNLLNYEAGVDAIKEGLANGMVIMEYDGDYAEIPEIQYWFGGSNYEIGYAIGKMAGEWANEVLVSQGIPVIAALSSTEQVVSSIALTVSLTASPRHARKPRLYVKRLLPAPWMQWPRLKTGFRRILI